MLEHFKRNILLSTGCNLGQQSMMFNVSRVCFRINTPNRIMFWQTIATDQNGIIPEVWIAETTNTNMPLLPRQMVKETKMFELQGSKSSNQKQQPKKWFNCTNHSQPPTMTSHELTNMLGFKFLFGAKFLKPVHYVLFFLSRTQ